jgi:hypothetical protein
MPAGLVIAILVGWFVVSSIVQVRLPAIRRLRRFDPIGLLPRWNLFSPRPIVSDLIVRYRLWVAPQHPLEWRTLPFPAERGPTDGIFSRQRRAKKALYWQAEHLVAIYRRHLAHPRVVMNSLPYRHLLARVSREVRGSDALGVQFQVIRVSRAHGPDAVTVPLFRSAAHRLQGE